MGFPPKAGAKPPAQMGGGNPFAKPPRGGGAPPSGKPVGKKKFSKGGRATARRGR